MIRGLYTSTMGMMVLSKTQEATANNLANANSVGYKKDRAITQSFADMLLYRLNDPMTPLNQPRVGNVSKGIHLAEMVTDFSRGVQQQTDKPFSLMIKGEGFFTLQTPQGERYTRNGEFSFSDAGDVVSADGYPVLGMKGTLKIKGDFVVSEDGTVYSDGEMLDKLKIVVFESPLTKEGASLFAGDNAQEQTKPVIVQGFIEESNVNPIEEMVGLIELMRGYEANQKALQTQDSTLDKAVNEIGRL